MEKKSGLNDRSIKPRAGEIWPPAFIHSYGTTLNEKGVDFLFRNIRRKGTKILGIWIERAVFHEMDDFLVVKLMSQDKSTAGKAANQ